MVGAAVAPQHLLPRNGNGPAPAQRHQPHCSWWLPCILRGKEQSGYHPATREWRNMALETSGHGGVCPLNSHESIGHTVIPVMNSEQINGLICAISHGVRLVADYHSVALSTSFPFSVSSLAPGSFCRRRSTRCCVSSCNQPTEDQMAQISELFLRFMV